MANRDNKFWKLCFQETLLSTAVVLGSHAWGDVREESATGRCTSDLENKQKYIIFLSWFLCSVKIKKRNM